MKRFLLIAALFGACTMVSIPGVFAEDRSEPLDLGQGASSGSGINQPPNPVTGGPPGLAVPLSPDLGGPSPNTLLPFDYWRYPGVDSGKVIAGGGAKGISATIRLVWNGVKQMLAAVLIFFIGALGIQLMIARGNEEAMSKVMNQLLYMLVGTAIVIFADHVSQIFSLYREYQGVGRPATTFISGQDEINATGAAFNEMIMIIIRFIRYLLGGIAVFYVIKSGLNILMATEDEVVSKEKAVFMYGFVGFIFILIAEALVNVVFDVDTLRSTYGEGFGISVNVTGGVRVLMNIANVLLAAMSGLFLFSLVAGGALYTFSAGNEERGKKATTIIIASLTGLVVAFSSYTVVAEFTSGGRSVELREVKKEVEPLSLPDANIPARNL